MLTESLVGNPLPASAKRQLDATPKADHDLVRAKRARLTADTAVLEQPTPNHPGVSSFLRRLADPLDPSPPRRDAFVSEWLESVGSGKRNRCSKSDSYTGRVERPVARHTKSATEALAPPGSRSDSKQGEEQASAPSSSHTRSVAPTDASGPSFGPGVEHYLYMVLYLEPNGIYLRHLCDPLPDHVAELVEQVGRDRDSPGPSVEDVKQDRGLYDLSTASSKPEVERYFNTHVFPDPGLEAELRRMRRTPMRRQAVPSTGFQRRVSTPVPDTLYGYKLSVALQNRQVFSTGSDMIDGMVAIRGTEARLYVTWKHDEQDRYYMQEVESFVLHRPEHYLEFRRYVRNIIEWGKGRRLREIRDSLGIILEKRRKRAAAEAKTRPPSSDDTSRGYGSSAE
jgi:hypothetical protein